MQSFFRRGAGRAETTAAAVPGPATPAPPDITSCGTDGAEALNEAPEPHVEPLSLAARAAFWLVGMLLCLLIWGLVSGGLTILDGFTIHPGPGWR